jgi:hypothetical protein
MTEPGLNQMKRHTASLLIAFFCLTVSSVTFAGEFNSKIITSDGDALTLTIPDEHFLRIRTFTQQGGTERGVVAVSVNGGQTTNVLTAALIDESVAPESIKRVVVAGPAQVTVSPVPGATLFITYIRAADPDQTPTPTATVTPTPTPTVTPTPTPTPTP